MFSFWPQSTMRGVRMQAEQSMVGKVLSSLAMTPPMVVCFSTMVTLRPGVGQVESGLDAGHPAADDEDVLVDLDLVGEEGLEPAGLGHGHLEDVPGLLGGHRHVGVDPGAVLADVGHLEQVGVEAALRRRSA